MGFRLAIDDGRFAQTRHVDGDRMTVGRAGSNDVRLESEGVGRKHAMFRLEGEGVVVTELSSPTGLVVDGKRRDRVRLGLGDTVAIGHARITLVEITDAEGRSVARITPKEIEERRRAAAVAAVAASAAAAAPTPQAPAVESRAAEPAKASTAVLEAPAPAPTDPRPWIAPELARKRSEVGLHETDFSDLAYLAVRNAPWWMLSVAFHAVVFFVLALTPLTRGALDRTPPAKLEMNPGDQMVELDTRELDREQKDDPFDDLSPEEPEPEARIPLPERPPEQDELDMAPDEPPDFGRVGDRDEPDSGNQTVGLGVEGPLGGNLGSAFGKLDAGRANAQVADLLKGDSITRVLLRGLQARANENTVLVVSGGIETSDYDHCQNILQQLDLKHGMVSSRELGRQPLPRSVKVILVNCTNRGLTAPARRNLEEWVRAGGYLFTTDWGVENVVEACMPGYIAPMRRNERPVMTTDETIHFEVERKHPLLRGLPRETAPPVWWLEDSSFPIEVLDPERVDVLIHSDEMEARYGSGVVAATFAHGNGRVVHVLGHFFQKEGNLRGAYAMQRLLMNYLHAGLKR